MRQISQATPSTWGCAEDINNQILTGILYNALKEAKNLVACEEESLQNARRGASLQNRGKAVLKSP